MNLKRPLLFIYALISVLAVYLLANHSEHRINLKAIPIIVLLVTYYTSVKTINVKVVLFFLSIILADLIIVNLDCFSIGLLFYCLSYLIISSICWRSFKSKVRKEIIKYFIIFFFLFLIVFIYTIKDKGNAFLSLFLYGVTLSMATSLLFTNYLKRMIPTNYYLFLAIAARIVSDSILTIVLFNDYNMYYSIIAHLIYFISNYLFYKGFILRNA